MSLPGRLPEARLSSLRGPALFAPIEAGLRRLASDLGIEITISPLASMAGATALAALLGSRVGGPPLAIASALLVIAAPFLARPIAERRARRARLRDLPDRCGELARLLRSGATIEAAVAEVAARLDDDDPFSRLAVELRAGRPLASAIRDWLSRSDHGSENLVASALLLACTSGGDPAGCVQSAAESVRAELLAEERRAGLVAGSRTTVRVLAMLPIAFAFLSTTLGTAPPLAGSRGVVLLAAGLGLDALGMAWMRILVRRFEQ